MRNSPAEQQRAVVVRDVIEGRLKSSKEIDAVVNERGLDHDKVYTAIGLTRLLLELHREIPKHQPSDFHLMVADQKAINCIEAKLWGICNAGSLAVMGVWPR